MAFPDRRRYIIFLAVRRRYRWKAIDVPSTWKPKGFDGYNGIAWYRVHFTSDTPKLRKALTLSLGKIDDADFTYLNRVRIGSKGRFPPDSLTAYDQPRVYRIPPGLLKARNVLPVRVYDMGGPGGIVFGPISIYDAKNMKEQFDPPPGPKKSFHQLAASIGLIAAVYNEQRSLIESVRTHIFQAYDSARFVESFVYLIKLTRTERPLKVFYRDQTHIITTTYRNVEVSYFASFTTKEKIFYIVVTGPAEEVANCSLEYESRKPGVILDSIAFPKANRHVEKYFLFGFTDSLHRDPEVVERAKAHLFAQHGDLVENWHQIHW